MKMLDEKPLSYSDVRQVPKYDQIKSVVEQFGVWEQERSRIVFEREEFKIEEVVSGIFHVINEGELVYSNIKGQRDPTAAVVNPGKWEKELYKWYVEAQK